MNKKENLFTTTLRLNLNNAQDMEAWNNLMSTDRNQPEYSSYSRTIITAIQRSLRPTGSHGGATGMGNSAAEKD